VRGLATVLLLLLGGCLVGPKYQRPVVTSPPVSRGQVSPEAASLADLPWWEVFRDPALHELMRTAIANNTDLRVAAQRVEQARQYRVQTHSEYLPGVGYEVGLSTGKNESLGALAGLNGAQRGTLAMGLSAAWEPDLWGRIRRLNEYALANYLASEQARRGVLLSLVTNVAQAYFELLALDLRLEIAQRNVKSFEASLAIFQERLEAGTASLLDPRRARFRGRASSWDRHFLRTYRPEFRLYCWSGGPTCCAPNRRFGRRTLRSASRRLRSSRKSG